MSAYGLSLATCSYSQFTPDMGVPVQISNGRPKWALKYTLTEKDTQLYPAWSLVKNKSLSVADFRTAYWAGLDTIGLEVIANGLQTIADRYEGHQLVLMCFEKRVEDCHRGDFAIWWLHNTGEAVPELGHTAQPVVDSSFTLF